MIKASEALIAWNKADDQLDGRGPPGSIAVGRLLNKDEPNWTQPYMYSGGAAMTSRRMMSGAEQQFRVMRDWYELVYGFGLDPYVVHTAFLEIEEYQQIIKKMGMGPDKGEDGHDPEVGYGRAIDRPAPPIEVKRIGNSLHVWPL